MLTPEPQWHPGGERTAGGLSQPWPATSVPMATVSSGQSHSEPWDRSGPECRHLVSFPSEKQTGLPGWKYKRKQASSQHVGLALCPSPPALCFVQNPKPLWENSQAPKMLVLSTSEH